MAPSTAAARGWLRFGGVLLPCALGRAGCRARKREGDGATPMGRWRAVELLYRPDRIIRPRTRLPIRPLRPNDGWCDAVGDRNYNRPVRHPYSGSAETLWRQDGLYDLVVVLDHNTRPRVQGLGSAIFMHVAASAYGPTAGCIALQRAHLVRLLERIDSHTVVSVGIRACKKRPERKLRAL